MESARTVLVSMIETLLFHTASHVNTDFQFLNLQVGMWTVCTVLCLNDITIKTRRNDARRDAANHRRSCGIQAFEQRQAAASANHI